MTRPLENHEVLTVTKLNIRESIKETKENDERSKFNFGTSISPVNDDQMKASEGHSRLGCGWGNL